MLPPFIIEQIRKREEENAIPAEQPMLEIPLVRPSPRKPQDEEKADRGVVILDLMGNDD